MTLIHILDKQTDAVVGTLNTEKGDADRPLMTRSIDNINTFEMDALSEFDKLMKRNRLLVQDVDGYFNEFIITHTDQYKRTAKEVRSVGSYVDLQTAKVVAPQKLDGSTPRSALSYALDGTEWRVGQVDYVGILRTIDIDEHTDPYSLIKWIAYEFEMEIRYRVEIDGNRITGRYVDLVKEIAGFEGKEITFGKDLIGIRRVEDSSNIVTALVGLGPVRDDGTRLEVYLEDQDALDRWGRSGRHMVRAYEPQSDDQDMTLERLTSLTRTELKKRIDAVVTYECQAVSLESVFGRSHEKIRLGQTVRIKDDGYTPPLYLEARIRESTENVATRAVVYFKIGNFIEFDKADLERQIDTLRKLLAKKVDDARLQYAIDQVEQELIEYAEPVIPSQNLPPLNPKIGDKWVDTSVTPNQLKIYDGTEWTAVKGDKGDTGAQGPKGDKGADGQTFYTWVKYADTPTTGMTDSPANKTYIGIAYNKTTSTPSTNYADYKWSLIKGEQGVQGPPGKDGQSLYTWIKYADTATGAGMSDSPDGKLYIGMAFNKTTPIESSVAGDYAWSLMPQEIEIGGRNLLLDTALTHTGKGKWATLPTIKTDDPLYPYVEQPYAWNISQDVNLPKGDYIVSVLAKEGTDTRSRARLSISYNSDASLIDYGATQEPLNTEWKKVSVKFTVTRDNESVRFYFLNADNVGNKPIKFTRFKLEKGNVATDWTPAPEDVQAEIDKAKQDALNAQQSADGKNTIFRQATQPSSVGRKDGDMWFNTAQGNRMSVFMGGAWTLTTLDHQALSVGKLSAISADLGDVTAGNITGVTLNLGNGKFIVDAQGNVKFAGDLSGATGTFGNVTVGGSGSSKLSVTDANNNEIAVIDKDGVTVTDARFLIKDGRSGLTSDAVARSNLIKDHSFELIPIDYNNTRLAGFYPPVDIGKIALNSYFNWRIFGSAPYVHSVLGTDETPAVIMFGHTQLLVNRQRGIRQVIPVIPGEKYTISGHFGRPVGMTSGQPRISVQFKGDDFDTVVASDFRNFPTPSIVAGAERYERRAIPVTVPANTFYMEVIIFGLSDDYVVVDGVQCVVGTSPTPYNDDLALYDALNGLTKANELNVDALTVGGQSTPFNLTLQNGYTPYQHGLRCFKDSLGFVHVWGTVQAGLTDQGHAIANLPIGYRPLNPFTLLNGAAFVNSTEGYRPVSVESHTNGNLLLQTVRPNTGILKITGSFFAGN